MATRSGRRLGPAIVLAVGLAVLSTAAVAAARSSLGRQRTALPSGTYKIGYVEGITGRLAFYDVPFAQGMKVRIAQVNAKGGVGGKVKLQLLEQDGKSSPAQGGIAARSLLASHVQFGVAPCDLDLGLPAGQVFEKAKIPNVLSCANGWTYPKIVGPYAFTNAYGTSAMGAGMAQYAISRGWRRACDYSSNDYFYGKNVSDVFDAVYKKLGGKIVCHLYYHFSDTDFRAVATQIQSAKPQVVATSLVFPGTTTFLKQVRAAGYDGPVRLGRRHRLGSSNRSG